MYCGAAAFISQAFMWLTEHLFLMFCFDVILLVAGIFGGSMYCEL
jgi:hypothetical protein